MNSTLGSVVPLAMFFSSRTNPLITNWQIYLLPYDRTFEFPWERLLLGRQVESYFWVETLRPSSDFPPTDRSWSLWRGARGRGRGDQGKRGPGVAEAFLIAQLNWLVLFFLMFVFVTCVVWQIPKWEIRKHAVGQFVRRSLVLWVILTSSDPGCSQVGETRCGKGSVEGKKYLNLNVDKTRRIFLFATCVFIFEFV